MFGANPVQVVNDQVQPLPLNQLHRIEDPLIIVTDFKDGDDIGVVHPSCCAGFTLKPLQGLFIGRMLLGQHLQGNASAQ